MDNKKNNITVTITELENALNQISSYTEYEQTEAIENLNIEKRIEDLDDLLADFQRKALTTRILQKAYDEFETRREILEKNYDFLKTRFSNEKSPNQDLSLKTDEENPLTQRLIAQKNTGDGLLAEMNERTNAIRDNIERIEDTLDVIDEDILDQREKLYRVRDKVRESQNVVKRLEVSLKELTKTLYQDKCIKGMILLLGIVVVFIGIMIVRIKIRQIDTKTMDDFEYFLRGNTEGSFWETIDEEIFIKNCQIDRRRKVNKKKKKKSRKMSLKK